MLETRPVPGVTTRPAQGQVSVLESEVRHIDVDGEPAGAADTTATVEHREATDGVDDEPLRLRLLPGEARALAAILVRAAERVELREEVIRD